MTSNKDTKEANKNKYGNAEFFESVDKMSEIMQQLLMLGGKDGVKENDLYLMFNSPKPTDIILHLRFGLLKHICLVIIDRFGRRAYYLNTQLSHASQVLFYSQPKVTARLTDLMQSGDMLDLSDFVSTV